MTQEMTIREYAAAVGLSTDTIRRRIKLGILPAAKKLDNNIPTWFIQLDGAAGDVMSRHPSTLEIAEWLLASPWLEIISRSIDSDGQLSWTVRPRSQGKSETMK